MKKDKPKHRKVILLGSGALKIGEAGEFDYSGSQAAKALSEEGIKTVLVNPNIATIQTSKNFVDSVYFLPVNPYFVRKIIEKEAPCGIMLGFGGQTALNCGLELENQKVLKKNSVSVLGTPVSSIKKTEDRELFRNTIDKLGYKSPKSMLCTSLEKAEKAAEEIGYPVIIRAGYSLGGLGSGIATSNSKLKKIAANALAGSPQILIEEYLENWKEIEYEVVRDSYDNAVTVCNMENFDPMGIHTGESIVVAPSQTLTNNEYHFLREVAIDVVRKIKVVGECNIQFALNPKNGDYRIIELNARLSRSSALASKATGYPLAYIACKLALGKGLWEVDNQVTKATCSFFEPALDYVVVKIPRWDFLKFKSIKKARLGSEMQSVGEVMAIGRSFEEAFQKAIRSLDLDYEGIISDDLDKDLILERKKKRKIKYKSLRPTPDRPYNIAYNLFYGQEKSYISRRAGIDRWFLDRIDKIVGFYKQMIKESKTEKIKKETLLKAKKLGFSDQQIAEVYDQTSDKVRKLRKRHSIVPFVCQIDTLAGEFPAKTNYLYFSYHREEHDVEKTEKKPVIILGGGPYQIGSSVEFDWCAVNCVLTIKRMGYSPIMVNCNPETVSTDYDISDKLYFEELTLERVLDIVDFEASPVIVSMGGQTPNTLSPKLAERGVDLLGTDSENIERAEDREKFSALLDNLGIPQPVWKRLTSGQDAVEFAESIGYPVLVRPSFVLSGRAMFEVYLEKDFYQHLDFFKKEIDSDYPLVISKFIQGAKEVDFDAVAKNGEILSWAISEHVEHSGVHSGDATLVLPTFSLEGDVIDKVKNYSGKIAENLSIMGPFNIQFLVKENKIDNNHQVMVIEANLRASRSFPFVSKVLGKNFINQSTEVILGKKAKKIKAKKMNYFGVKVPRFSFTRLRGVDPILRIEMASTGEVASFGDSLYETYLKALLSTDLDFPKKSVLLSIGGLRKKKAFLPPASLLYKNGYKIYATSNTCRFLKKSGIKAYFVYKMHQKKEPDVVDVISGKKASFVVNISERSDLSMRAFKRAVTDGYLIRRASVNARIPLFTKVTTASLFIRAIVKYQLKDLKIKDWEYYIPEFRS